jgi:hypothetical protein
MGRIFPVLALIVGISAVLSCKKNPQEEMYKAVSEAAKKVINEPENYQAVSFEVDTLEMIGDNIRNTFQVKHSYCHKERPSAQNTVLFKVVQFGDEFLVTDIQDLD